jgi:hypothetical protein
MTITTDPQECRKIAITALDTELKLKTSGPPAREITNESKRKQKRDDNKYEKLRKDARAEAKLNLLALRVLRDRSGSYIPDQDRATLNEAIRARVDPKYIAILLEDYPKACESGGCVDHINHPIHVACEFHRAAIPVILKAAPECAGQQDEKETFPLEMFLTNKDMIDITPEEFASTVNSFCKLSPTSTTESFVKRESIKEHFLMHLLPTHLKNAIES